ncbi:MAG: hypothetical protein ACRBN8_29990 [Nannocystales bacterium]
MLWLPFALLLAPGPGVRWQAPSVCPDERAVAARLEAADVGVTQPVAAQVIPPAGTATGSPVWRLEVRMGESPLRVLEGESCDALTDALVAMLSVQTHAEPPPTEPSEPDLPPPELPSPPRLPAVTHPPPAPSAPPAEAPPKARADPPSGLRSPAVVLGVAAGLHGVGVPGLGGGLGADLGLRFPHLRLAGYGRWWFRREQEVVSPIKAGYRLAAGGIEACGVARFGQIEALGCGLAELGELRAEGIDAAPSRTQRHLWVGPGARLGAQWRTRGILRLGLSAVALAPLNRRRFNIGDAPAGQVGPVELRALVHIGVAIPTSPAKKADGR